MTLPNTPSAYVREYEVFDRALESERGVRIPYPTHNAAVTYRSRLHYARKVERARSRDIYTPEDRAYNTSPYDGLTCTIERVGDTFYLCIRPGSTLPPIEDIPECAPSLPNSPSPSGTTPSPTNTASPSLSMIRRI